MLTEFQPRLLLAVMALNHIRRFDYWSRQSGGFSLRCAVLEYKLSPQAYIDQFSKWPLSYVSGALGAHGYDLTLPCGCKALLPPRHYTAVLEHLTEHGIAFEDMKLRSINSLHPRHVIVSWEFEGVLSSSMERISSVHNVRVKRRYDFSIFVLPEINLLIGPDELARRIIAASTMEALFN